MSLSAMYSALVLGFPFDEASGNRVATIGSRTLTDSGSAGSAAGKFSNAVDFERDKPDAFYIGSNTDLQTGDIDFFWLFWFKPESLPGTMTILTKGNLIDGADNEYSIYIGSDNYLGFRVCDSGGTQTDVKATDFGTLSAGTMYLGCVYHDATNNKIAASVNAVTTESSYSAGVRSGTSDGYIGMNFPGGDRAYDGLLDDLCLGKGYIPSSADLTAVYNGGTGVAFSSWAAAATKAPPSFRRPARFFQRSF